MNNENEKLEASHETWYTQWSYTMTPEQLAHLHDGANTIRIEVEGTPPHTHTHIQDVHVTTAV